MDINNGDLTHSEFDLDPMLLQDERLLFNDDVSSITHQPQPRVSSPRGSNDDDRLDMPAPPPYVHAEVLHEGGDSMQIKEAPPARALSQKPFQAPANINSSTPATIVQHPISDSTVPKNQPSKVLRKSFSDPSTALINDIDTGQVHFHPPSPFPMTTVDDRGNSASNGLLPLWENAVQDQGPWTREALDLFDFWPPGREKPC